VHPTNKSEESLYWTFCLWAISLYLQVTGMAPECQFAQVVFVGMTDFSDEYSQHLGVMGSNGE
jgi:hypothetical protein